MPNISSGRNSQLDFIKGIGCICVVLVHFQFPGAFGKILCSVGVSAVILFFLISGYAAKLQQDNPQKLQKRIKRNAFICIYGIAVYFVFSIIFHLLQNDFAKWIHTMSDPLIWVRFFLLGDFEIINADPLWFMPALIYSYIIIYFMEKFKLEKIAYKLIPLFIIIRIGMETFTNSTGTDWHLSGNFFVGALPIMLLGHYIASKKEKFEMLIINPNHILGFALLGALYTFLCVSMDWKIDLSQPGKILMATSFFILALLNPQKEISHAVSFIGRNLSLNVYILHFLLGNTIKYILTVCKADDIYFEYILPPATIAISLIISYIIYKISFAKKKNVK